MKKQRLVGLIAVLLAASALTFAVMIVGAKPAQETLAHPQSLVAGISSNEDIANVPVLQQSSVITQFTFWPIRDTQHGLIQTDDLSKLMQVLTPEEIDNFLLDNIESDFGFRNYPGGSTYHQEDSTSQ